MLEFRINDQTFEVEFRHRRKNLKRPARSELYARSPVRAITVCSIRGVAANGRPYHAAGTSICMEPDNWSRALGRWKAFEDAVTRCGMLRPLRERLFFELSMRFPQKTAPESSELSPAQKLQLASDGQEKRLIRQQIREGAVVTPEQYALIKPQTKRAGGS